MNRPLAYALLALLYLAAVIAGVQLWVLLGVAGPAGGATILPDFALRKAVYFAALIASIAGAAIVHALARRRPPS